jgi:hypothetical protein
MAMKMQQVSGIKINERRGYFQNDPHTSPLKIVKQD